MLKGILLGSLGAFILSTSAKADAFYDSLASSIGDASAQARAILNHGTYVTTVQGIPGSPNLTWHLHSDTDTSFKFEYKGRALKSAEISFTPPVELSYKAGNYCFTVKIPKITYDGSGWPLPDPSWIYDTPSGCSAPTASLVVARHVAFPVKAEKLFLARPMAGFDKIAKCDDSGEDCTPSNPIQYIRFFPVPDKAAVEVHLIPAAKLTLPNGYLLFKSGQLLIDQLEYSPADDIGQGEIRTLDGTLLAGSLGSGATELSLTEGTAFTIANLKMEKAQRRISFKDGIIKGSVGAGTRVPLYQSPTDISNLSFNAASATLVGVNFTINDGKLDSLSVTSGELEGEIAGGDILFSKGNRVLIGTTNAKIRLACPADIQPCAALRSGPGGSVAFGEISNFKSQIIGGSLTFEQGLSVNLDTGRLTALLLRFDSRFSNNPVTGRFETVNLTLKKEAFQISNTKVTVQSAAVVVTSSDLYFLLGDPLPVGTALLAGTAERVTWLNGADIGVQVNNANISFPISREGGKRAVIGKDPINRGRIEASIIGTVGPGGSATSATAGVVLREITGVIGGSFSGKLDLTGSRRRVQIDQWQSGR